MANLTPESAARFLSNVPEQNRFWCNDGKTFCNLEDLKAGLKGIKDEHFTYHVNEEKNDFSKWVYDIVGDIDLASALRNCQDRKTALKKVKARLTTLKNFASKL